MILKINGEQKTMNQESITISELLKQENVESPDMVSVQVNGEFVDREEYSNKTVLENSDIDFLYFMGGGGR